MHLSVLLAILLLNGAIGEISAGGRHSVRRYFPENRKHQRQYKRIDQGDVWGPQTVPRKYHELKSLSLRKSDGNITTVISQTGSTAILHCRVNIMQKKTYSNITWSKQINDSLVLLTANTSTITWDKRFYANNEWDPMDWMLHIKYTENSDTGRYVCQIFPNNSSPVLVNLKLIEAYAKIFGDDPDVKVKAGSPLRLSCFLVNSISPPTYIFWYHKDRMINYDMFDGAAVRLNRKGSELIIPRVELRHSGNYSCVPSNARQISVTVEVLGGHSDKPEAEQRADKNNMGLRTTPQHCVVVNMLLLVLTCHLRR